MKLEKLEPFREEEERLMALRGQKYPVLFLENYGHSDLLQQYQQQQKRIPPSSLDDSLEELPGLTEVKRWRLQTLLAANDWGIPSLALAEAYERMFRRPLDIHEWGFEDLSDMINQLSDIFVIQEPDEMTALMFPDYAQDVVLHDARFGHTFVSPDLAALDHHHHHGQSPAPSESGMSQGYGGGGSGSGGSEPSLERAPSSASSLVAASSSASTAPSSTASSPTKTSSPKRTLDPDTLIAYAWLNRDEELPRDVVLTGEQYDEFILPMTQAQIPDTNGVHQMIIVGAASPSHIYINISSEQLEVLARLSADVADYFDKCGRPMEMYKLPQEFICPNFACLVYVPGEQAWERCSIIQRSPKGHKIMVEMVDFGGTRTVNQTQLYLMPHRFFHLPRQAVLVSLLGLKPPLAPGDSTAAHQEQANSGELVATAAAKWPFNAGRRVRHFSDTLYYLDCVLRRLDRNPRRSYDVASEVGADGQQQQLQRKKKRWSTFRQAPQYELIACDRNDKYFDIYLDEILTMETYAQYDETRLEQLEIIKRQFREVLANIPRPKNPYYLNDLESKTTGETKASPPLGDERVAAEAS